MKRSVAPSFLGQGTLATRMCMGLMVGVWLTTGCTSTSPPAPSAVTKTSSPNISVVSMSVAAETLASGARAYRVIVRLRESGGAAATIAAIDLTFMGGSTTVASSHADHPISDSLNTCPANATVDSRELMTMDDNPSDPYATSVIAKVTFTDGASMTSSTTATADVPASSPPPATFTLSGLVSDDIGSRVIVGGTVQVVDGPNAGKMSSTNGNGNYSLPGLAGGSFTVRATADGYDASEQSATVSKDTRLDLRLRPIAGSGPSPTPPPSGPCSYTIGPSSNATEWKGGSFTATITRTSGSCSWSATTDVSWIIVSGGASGNGSATLSYIVAGNGSDTRTRFGGITVSWSGGSARLAVQQAGASMLCDYTVSTGQQDLGNVPSAGGQFTATITWIDTGVPPGACSLVVSSYPGWLKSPSNVPPGAGSLTFSVDPNPSPGTSRSGTVNLIGRDKNATIGVTQR
jgi:hypothetical protein